MNMDINRVLPKLVNLIGELQVTIAIQQARIEELEAEIQPHPDATKEMT